MDEDQKRAIGRTSCIVKDFLSITIGDCVLFVGRHVELVFCVGTDSCNEAMCGYVWLRIDRRVAVLLWASFKYGRTACRSNSATIRKRLGTSLYSFESLSRPVDFSARSKC